MAQAPRMATILLIEDNPGDVYLVKDVFEENRLQNDLHVVEDGVAAMAFLRHEGEYAEAPRPDLILLDLNMPRKDGREVLAEVKADENLRGIPVAVLTTSREQADILRADELDADCYIIKPVDMDQFMLVVRSLDQFGVALVAPPDE